MNVKILEIGVYTGETEVDNSFYIEHFRKQGKDVSHLLNDVMKKDKRYVTRDKNSLTMGLEALLDALDKNNLKGEDLDFIIFSSSLPEVLSPPCSILLHNLVKGKEEAFCFDINVNCSGMTAALELARGYLLANEKCQRGVIVGCDYLNAICDTNNELCYGHYGDVGCAIILEKTKENSQIFCFNALTDSVICDVVGFPRKGFSELVRSNNIKKEDFYIFWKKFGTQIVIDTGVAQIKRILDENKLKIEDINAFCFSQFGYRNNKEIERILDIDPNKVIYIGDKYGYTGTSSPFIALYEGIQQGKIKRGDLVIIWTIAMGAEGVCTLLRY